MSDPVKLTIVEPFVTASDRPVMGERRLVRQLPVPGSLTGAEVILRPAIWISPYEFYDADIGAQVKICIVLVNSGPPKPEIISVRIPSNAIEKFPLAPVEW